MHMHWTGSEQLTAGAGGSAQGLTEPLTDCWGCVCRDLCRAECEFNGQRGSGTKDCLPGAERGSGCGGVCAEIYEQLLMGRYRNLLQRSRLRRARRCLVPRPMEQLAWVALSDIMAGRCARPPGMGPSGGSCKPGHPAWHVHALLFLECPCCALL